MTVTRGDLIDAYLVASRACHAQATLLTGVAPALTSAGFGWPDRLHAIADQLGTCALWLASHGEVNEEL